MCMCMSVHNLFSSKCIALSFFEHSLCAKHYVKHFIFNALFMPHEDSGKKILLFPFTVE